MKVKELIKKLEELAPERNVTINSESPFIIDVEDFGASYCIYGTDVIPEDIL